MRSPHDERRPREGAAFGADEHADASTVPATTDIGAHLRRRHAAAVRLTPLPGLTRRSVLGGRDPAAADERDSLVIEVLTSNTARIVGLDRRAALALARDAGVPAMQDRGGVIIPIRSIAGLELAARERGWTVIRRPLVAT